MTSAAENAALDQYILEKENPSGAAVLRKVHDFLGRFVAYPCEHSHVAHTLWIGHTHLMDLWDSTPRLAFLSAEPQSGKSRAMEVTDLLVPMPVTAVNVSPAYLFRKVGAEEGRPTILHDEIDTVFGPKAKENEEIRGLLNAGHRKGATAGRCVVHGKTVMTEEIPAYCAVALAGLGWLPETILQRSVIIRMRRRRADEKVEPFRRRIHAPNGEAIRRQLETWARAQGQQLEAWPEMPPEIQDRAADVWEPLLAVADMAGGQWPELARVAAVALVAASKEVEPSLGIRLLTDTRTIFGEAEQITTADLLRRLHDLPETPWNDLKGRPIDDRGLSRRLNQYGIKPRGIRVGDATPRGYRRADFFDAWTRYLPPIPAGSATGATSATKPPPVADVAHVADLAAARGDAPTQVVDDDLGIPTFLQRTLPPCAQCNDSDGRQRKHGAVWLHRECVAFYEGRR